jgi:hypothetical protein
MANISAIKLPDNTTYNIKAGAIPYGEVDSTSTSTAYTATVPGINELKNGTIMLLRNGVVTSASGFKININGLGAKPVYNNLTTGNTHTPTNPTRDTTIFNINYTMLFIYDEELVSGGAWICYRGYDSNSNTIGYQLRGNNSTRPAADKGYRYRIWLSSLDNQSWVPINTSTATNATTARSLNSRVIDPFGEIVYYSTNDTTDAGERLTATTIWQQYALTIGYSYVKSLTAWDPVYLKCEPQTGGGAVMKDIVQALPSTADGFIYIYLGIAYSTTAMELRFYHPVYYHDGTGIRAWTGTKIPTKTSELTNDSGFIEGVQVNGTDLTVSNNKVNVTKSGVVGEALTVTRASDETEWDIDSWRVTSEDIDSDTSYVRMVMNLKQGDGRLTNYRFYTAETIDTYNAMIGQALNGKVDKVTGKGLSTNDYTDAEKAKLEGIYEGANVIGAVALQNTNYIEKVSLEVDDNLTDARKTAQVYSSNVIDSMFSGAQTVLNGKVDKVTGKGLSTNDFTDAEKTKLAGIAAGAEANVNADWNATTGDAQILNKPTTISGYGITDAYTKAQVDGLVASVLHYKGTKASVANLPTSGNTIGDVWHITADGSEYAWDGSVWQELGTAIDLSGYAIKATTLAGYGISDAKIESGTITLGSNSITPLTSETDPVFSASAAANITTTDIANWNAKVSDTKTWGDVVAPSSRYDTTDSRYIPQFSGTSSSSGTTATFAVVRAEPFAMGVPKWDANQYLYAATPSANDNSTKVATTAFVQSAIPTIPTKTSDLTNDSNFITEQRLLAYPTTIDLYETCQSTVYTLVINGTTATLYHGSSVAGMPFFLMHYASVAGVVVAQVLNGASTIQTAEARVYDVAEIDSSNAKVRLVSVDDGVVYTADLQDMGDGLTGTFSSQIIPMGGITTETDPTVPAWAKASTKPTYTASEVGALPDTITIPEATTAINDSGYIYNGQTVDSKISGVGLATSTNLLTSTSDTYALLRGSSTNPLLGLKCGSNLWYAQAMDNYFYFGPTSTKAMRLDQNGNALFVGTVQANGDLTLYTPSGNSPGIIFQRGTLTDNYNDWKIYDKSGFLYFAQRGSGSSAFGDMGYIDTGGVLRGFTIPWGSVSGKPTQLPTVTSSDNGKVLRVVDGAWSAVALPSASGVSF